MGGGRLGWLRLEEREVDNIFIGGEGDGSGKRGKVSEGKQVGKGGGVEEEGVMKGDDFINSYRPNKYSLFLRSRTNKENKCNAWIFYVFLYLWTAEN